jgi:hypothetical protein
MNEYINVFKFGFKLLLLLLCLFIPFVMLLVAAPFPADIVRKTPFYSEPLLVNGLWQVKSAEKVSADDKGNEKYRITLASGEVTAVDKKQKEGVYNLEDNLFVRTNRKAKGDLENKGIMYKVMSRIENPAFGPEIKEYMVQPGGYYSDILVKPEYFTLAGRIVINFAILIITVFCIALYFPIVRALVKLLRKR